LLKSNFSASPDLCQTAENDARANGGRLRSNQCIRCGLTSAQGRQYQKQQLEACWSKKAPPTFIPQALNALCVASGNQSPLEAEVYNRIEWMKSLKNTGSNAKVYDAAAIFVVAEMI